MVRAPTTFRATPAELAKHPKSHCIFLLLSPRFFLVSAPGFISKGEVNCANIPLNGSLGSTRVPFTAISVYFCNNR
jgi:hypothetical protein